MRQAKGLALARTRERFTEMTVNYGEVIESRGIQTGRIVRQGNRWIAYVAGNKISFASYRKAVRFVAALR